jgi:CBS domain-containing protein
MGLLPLLGGCAAAYLVSCLLMRHSIMTVKIARRGVAVPAEYGPDALDQVSVRDCASGEVVALAGGDRLGEVRAWLSSGAAGAEHQGFPVVDDAGGLLGVVTRRDVERAQGDDRAVVALLSRPAVVAFEDETLRQAVDRMAMEGIGRLPVVLRGEPRRLVGMLTRSDVLLAYRRQIEEERKAQRVLSLQVVRLARPRGAG